MEAQAKSKKNVLMVFIEPTPYILGFIRVILPLWIGSIDVLFLKENVTQQWGLTLDKRFALLPASRLKAIHILWQCLFKKKYDLIHVAGWSNPICLLFIVLSRLVRIPVTVESDTQLNGQLPMWKKMGKRVFYPFLFKLPTHFFPGGSRQAAYFRHYGVSKTRITIAQMTVDVLGIQDQTKRITSTERDALRQQYGAQGSNSIVYLFVGRLLEWKGLRELIAAFLQLQNRYAVLWVAGEGPLKNEVANAVTLQSNVHYLGRLNGKTLIACYHASDIVVVPSYHDPWGLVVNEAMAAGCPVIATANVGASEDLIQEGVTGLLATAKSVSSLRQKMQQCLDHPHLIAKMSSAAHALISSWTLEAEALRILSGWLKVCNDQN